jgi:CHRD domain
VLQRLLLLPKVLHTASASTCRDGEGNMHRLQIALIVGLIFSADLPAQPKAQYRARLSPVPIDVAMQSTVAGSGSATAVLVGTTLTVNGTFTGLKSPATVARIHVGPKGIRGPAAFDLQVTGGVSGVSGTIRGVFTLTPHQLDDLAKNRLYIQLHSEKAGEGNLWGWLLPHEARQ